VREAKVGNYVLGFAFTPHQEVILIRKKRPDWQVGKLNGVGGHIEEGENSYQAMVREFKEETGVAHVAWAPFCIMKSPNWVVHCFAARGVIGAETKTDEEVVLVDMLDLPIDVIPNLRWLIPMAWNGETFAEVDYP
jgi:8-oxo-dGTP diphosphatase